MKVLNPHTLCPNIPTFMYPIQNFLLKDWIFYRTKYIKFYLYMYGQPYN